MNIHVNVIYTIKQTINRDDPNLVGSIIYIICLG